MIKKIVLLIITLTLTTSCGNGNRNNKSNTIDSIKSSTQYLKRVRELEIRLTTEKDSIQEAIALLDSAIALNSKNIKALLLKQRYQIWLGEYGNALETMGVLENLKPKDPNLKSTKGLLYLLKGNNKYAEIALKQSVNLWNIRLDTISQSNEWKLLGALVGKAASLKLLGKEKQSNNVYRRILNDSTFNKAKYKEIKNTIDSLFLNQTKEELYNYLVRQLQKNETPTTIKRHSNN